MTVRRRNPAKFPGPLTEVEVRPDDPLKKLTDSELLQLIVEKDSLVRALSANNKVIIECRETAKKAELILQERKVEIPKSL